MALLERELISTIYQPWRASGVQRAVRGRRWRRRRRRCIAGLAVAVLRRHQGTRPVNRIEIDGGEVLLIDGKLQRRPGVDGRDADEPRWRARAYERRIAVPGLCASSGSTVDALHASLAPRSRGLRLRAHPIGDEDAAAVPSRWSGSYRSTSLPGGTSRPTARSRTMHPAMRCCQGVELDRPGPTGRARRGGPRTPPDRRASRVSGSEPHPLHQLPRRGRERDRIADRRRCSAPWSISRPSCDTRARASDPHRRSAEPSPPSAGRRRWAAS